MPVGVRRVTGARLARADVATVIVDSTDEAPGTTVDGLNEQVEPAGRLAHVSVTAF